MSNYSIKSGEYNAKAYATEIKTSYGKPSFKIILHIDTGEEEPFSLWHMINSRYAPSIVTANVLGWILGDDMLKSLTTDKVNDMVHEAETYYNEHINSPAFNVVVSTREYNGKTYNGIEFVLPYRKLEEKKVEEDAIIWPEPLEEKKEIPTLDPFDDDTEIPF